MTNAATIITLYQYNSYKIHPHIIARCIKKAEIIGGEKETETREICQEKNN
jgi:hypothetical protein